jgi:triosephosphate isomerase
MLFAGNWKMFKSAGDVDVFLRAFVASFAGRKKIENKSEFALLVPAPLLPVVAAYMDAGIAKDAESAGLDLAWGPQNTHWEAEGAFTGELSPALAQEFGSRFALSGHSERRQFFGETDESAARRAIAAHKFGMRAIFCVGENLEERESGKLEKVLERQCKALTSLAPQMPAGFVVAYEPVWAIGTGKNATAKEAEAAHAFLRELLARRWGREAQAKLQILYGGSVKPENSAELLGCDNIDGVLVGGASLNPQSFFAIAANAKGC